MSGFCGIWGESHQEEMRLNIMRAYLPLSDEQPQSEGGTLLWSGASFFNGLVFLGSIFNQSELALLVGGGAVSNAELVWKLLGGVGIEKGLEKINGQFALCWQEEDRLLLARDHFGLLPLYYGQIKNDFVYATRLQCLSNHPNYVKKLDIRALTAFIKYNWVPDNLCIYDGLHKLRAGHYLLKSKGQAAVQHKYFDPAAIALEGLENSFREPDQDIIEHFRQVLDNAISCRYTSEPAQGLLLSGGMDSSLLAALLSRKGPVNSFTIGFSQASLNEAPYARQVASKMAVNHCQHILQGPEALELLPVLAGVYDEPFADQSQIPTLAAFMLARPANKILWMGDGADEIFMGYSRQLSHAKYAVPLNPRTGRPSPASYLSHPWRAFLHFGLRQNVDYLKRHITNRDYPRLLLNPQEPDLGLEEYRLLYTIKDPVRQASLFDVLTYLPGSYLVKTGRLNLALGFDTRSPFLDMEIFKFAQRMPMRLLARGKRGKIILRHLLAGYYPRQWIERPKSGFNAPVTEWLKSDFAVWSKPLLAQVKQQGIFDYQQIEEYQKQLGTRGSATNKLWAVLMFQAWAAREGVF